MSNYYDILREDLEKKIKELDKAFLEKRALYLSRRSWNDESYRKEEIRIDNTIKDLSESINTNKELLATYDLVKSYTEDIRIFTNMYNEEKDSKVKDEISNELLRRREYINKKLDSLPTALSNDLRKNYLETEESIEDKKVYIFEQEKANLVSKLNIVKEKVSNSTKNIKNIFEDEKFLIEKNFPYETEKDLAEFINTHMSQKISENEVLNVYKKQQELLEKKVRILDKKIEDRRKIVSEARKININPDDYENILTRIKNRDEVTKFLTSLGLTELVEKRNKLLNPTKEELERSRELIKNRLVEEKIKQRKRSSTKTLPPKVEVKELKKVPKEAEFETNNITKKYPNKSNIDIAAYNYKTIINNLVQGLQPDKKDGKRYRASNIDIRQSFKDELHSGNYLYNIVHVVPAIIKLPINLIRKLSSKITYREEAKNRMKIIKNRLDNLSDNDLMILYKEYSNHASIERYGTGLNILISERINRFVDEKVDSINKDLEIRYRDIFNSVKELDTINAILHNKDLSLEQRKMYESYKRKLVKGKAEEVLSVRKDYEDAKTLLSSGLHGFNENMKATESKMSYIGKRFAKDHDLDVELLEREAKIEKAERQAIIDGNDEMALRCFVEAEKLLSKNTKVERSIFGERSIGKKYYSPLAEKLDYRNDPFIRDIFTTIAIVGASLTTINALNQKNALDKNLDEINRQATELTNKKNAFIEGMKAENYQDSLNISNALERKALDESSEVHGGWSVGTNTYYDARNIAQNTYVDFYNNTKNAITDITNRYAKGDISQIEAMNLLQDVSKSSQGTLTHVVEESLPHLSIYARDHSQFDLSGVMETMNYIITNPEAITNMNNAMIDSINIAESIKTLSTEQINYINSIPSNISINLITAASSAALALKVNATINSNKKNGKYGNNITAIVENYIASQEENNKKVR